MTDVMQAVSALLSELSASERAVLASLLGPAAESVAVVGMGCRFPGGANDPEAFWQLLAAGRDTIREIPSERWDSSAYYDADPESPGRMYTRYGAFLDSFADFDPLLFDISPHEAARMDPQQRLLLEVAWEALEDAGQAPDGLRGSRTGVFIGSCGHDYAMLKTGEALPASIDAHTLTGDAASVLSGRLSYTFGLTGPSLTVDTACSSSLVALHLACQSLKNRECDLALVGGVNLILAPESFVRLSKMRALSPDGRCRSFDIRANGYARGEGVGLLVLQRLPDAQRDRRRIRAVVRGSAVNHDGRSASLTAPSGLAQVSVVRAALAAAGVGPAEVGYIEAHGTGTPLGDPIELEALKEVFGAPRQDGSTCAIGSVKTNIGHLEGAAGVAGVIKTIHLLERRTIPAHLHFTQLNPRVEIQGTPLFVAREACPFSSPRDTPVAGVSSFGISGTNAHVVLSAAPLSPGPRRAAAGTPQAITLSAKSEPALRELAQRYAQALAAEPDIDLADMAYTIHRGRARFPLWLSIVASSTADAAAALSRIAADPSPLEPKSGPAPFAADDQAKPVGRHIRLPSYPFQRQSFGLPRRTAKPAAQSFPGSQRDSQPGSLKLARQVVFSPQPSLPAPAPTQKRRWLLISEGGPGTELLTALVAELEKAQQVPVPWSASSGAVAVDELRQFLAEQGAELAGILDLRALGQADLRGTLALMQELIGWPGRGERPPRLFGLTRGAQNGSGHEEVRAVDAASLWGLYRVLGREHPELYGGLWDLDPFDPLEKGQSAAEAALLVAELLSPEPAPELLLRGGVRLLPELLPLPELSAASTLPSLRAAATYLITGGLGDLGLACAERLARRGARHLVLAGRRPPGVKAQEVLAALEREGVRVAVIEADIANVIEVRALFQRIDAGMPALAGIVHAAGVTEDAGLAKLDWDRCARVLAPKLAGSRHLVAMVEGRSLDFLVFFSSVAALFGNPGQASYAAANAFLDALAQNLRGRGIPALSLALGPVAGSGLSKGLSDDLARQRFGIEPLAVEEVLDELERLLRFDGGYVAVLSGQPSGFAQRPLAAAVTAPRSKVASRIAAAPPEERLPLLIEQVEAVTRSIMGLDPELRLNPNQRLDELGLDSMLALDLARGLEQALDTTLSTTLAMDYPTVAAMAEHLLRELH